MLKKISANYKASICTLTFGVFLIYLLNIAPVVCDDIFVIIQNLGKVIYGKLSGTLIALAPLVFLVDLVILFFTRDQRKFEVEKKILIYAAATFFGIVILDATIFSGEGMTQLKNTIVSWTTSVSK